MNAHANMNDFSATNEPTRFEVIASFKSVPNSTLARKVFALNTWTSYERHQAHTWALRLIRANPTTGAEVAAALVNFDYMRPAASDHYETRPRDRKRCDAILDVFTQWKLDLAAD